MSRSLLACALLTLQGAAACAPFDDVLDTPSQASALAAQALINGVAHAGTRLVAVGQRGHIVFSDDQGKHWTQAKVPVSVDLVALCFPTPLLGWAVGHDGVVLHSFDGGASWIRQLDGRSAAAILSEAASAPDASEAQRADAKKMVAQGPDKPFLDVWFDSATSGFVVGAFNLIFHTDDGGRSWTPWSARSANPKGFHLNAVRTIGGDTYAVGEQGLVVKLAKGADHFEALVTPYQGSYFGVVGHHGVLIVYGLRGNAYRSVDAGRSWQKVDTGTQVGLTAASVLPDGRFVLVSGAGQVLQSGDGGANFQLVRGAKAAPASGVVALGGDALLLGGLRGLRTQSVLPN